MDLKDFERIKLWYTQYLENSSKIKNENLNVSSLINKTFYLFDLGIFPEFFDQLDSLEFQHIVENKVGSASNKKEIISAIFNFKKVFQRYFISYDQWKQKNHNILCDAIDDEQEIVSGTDVSDIVKATYEAAKAYYEKRIDSSDKNAYYEYIQGYSQICGEKFNTGSANIYLSIFLKMMNRESFSGNPADPYLRYFLINIYKDFGLDSLNNALFSLNQHIKKSVQHKISLGTQIAQQYGAEFLLEWD